MFGWKSNKDLRVSNDRLSAQVRSLESKVSDTENDIQKLFVALGKIVETGNEALTLQNQNNKQAHANVTHVHDDVIAVADHFQRYLELRERIDTHLGTVLDVYGTYLETIMNLLNISDTDTLSDEQRAAVDALAASQSLTQEIEDFLRSQTDEHEEN